jgi:hypothetical protein
MADKILVTCTRNIPGSISRVKGVLRRTGALPRPHVSARMTGPPWRGV